jgi:thioester reductase-like protein
MLFRESFFITGFPGFIATRLVEKLASSQTQFFLLVQPQFIERAIAEIEQISEFTDTPLESFVIVEGDITKENLGIEYEDLQTLIHETTDVFHLAAVYDLAVDRDTAYTVNLEGTKRVNEFAGKLKNLRRYNYISTCYVAGKRTGEIREKELVHDAGFRNYYEETKYLAEIEVENLKDKMPVTIFRPSVVIGDSATGETVKYDGIYYLIQYLRKAPNFLRILNVGNDKVRLNLVPVDFVVDAIAALARDRRADGKTIALADPNPLTTAQLFDVIAKDLTGRKSEFRPPPWLVEQTLFLSVSPRITGLPHFAVPYFFISQTYDTTQAKLLLRPHNISCPRFEKYVTNIIDFVEENPVL